MAQRRRAEGGGVEEGDSDRQRSIAHVEFLGLGGKFVSARRRAVSVSSSYWSTSWRRTRRCAHLAKRNRSVRNFGCGPLLAEAVAGQPFHAIVLRRPRRDPAGVARPLTTPPPTLRVIHIKPLIIMLFPASLHFSYSSGYVLRNEILRA